MIIFDNLDNTVRYFAIQQLFNSSLFYFANMKTDANYLIMHSRDKDDPT